MKGILNDSFDQERFYMIFEVIVSEWLIHTKGNNNKKV